jgi:hypothetical protein
MAVSRHVGTCFRTEKWSSLHVTEKRHIIAHKLQSCDFIMPLACWIDVFWILSLSYCMVITTIFFKSVTNWNWKRNIGPVRNTKGMWGAELYLHSLLTSTLQRSVLLNSHSGRLTPWYMALIHWKVSSVDPRVALNRRETITLQICLQGEGFCLVQCRNRNFGGCHLSNLPTRMSSVDHVRLTWLSERLIYLLDLGFREAESLVMLFSIFETKYVYFQHIYNRRFKKDGEVYFFWR